MSDCGCHHEAKNAQERKILTIALILNATMAVVGGLVVGFGTGLGSGCTSGHGICGISRLSKRSIFATVIFMASGIATVTLMRLLSA